MHSRYEDFIINVGPNGTFRPSGTYQTQPEHIDSIFQQYETSRVKKITLYFHGGLVSERNGMITAEKMAAHISELGHAPLCFVWETGLLETISFNLTKISDTKLFNKLVKVLVKKTTEKLGFNLTNGRGAEIQLTDDQIDKELASPNPFQKLNQDKSDVAGRGANTLLLLENDTYKQSLEAELMFMIESDLEFTQAISETKLSTTEKNNTQSRGIITTLTFVKHVAVIAFKVIKRFIIKRNHDFYPTIIEEILREFYIAEVGAWVWNNMKVKSTDMWSDNRNRTGLNRFAGRYLLDKLMEYVNKNSEIEVNLIGHSAGAIAICNLLKAASVPYPQFKFNKIVFMAPACRIDLFKQEIVDKRSRFNNFRMFTMSDEFETQDRLVPYLYTHSLLYLISGILENEGKDFDSYILGLERHLQGILPYDSVQEIIATKEFLYEQNSNRILFSKSKSDSATGWKTNSITHGGFDDDDDTIESLQYFLREV